MRPLRQQICFYKILLFSLSHRSPFPVPAARRRNFLQNLSCQAGSASQDLSSSGDPRIRSRDSSSGSI